MPVNGEAGQRGQRPYDKIRSEGHLHRKVGRREGGRKDRDQGRNHEGAASDAQEPREEAYHSPDQEKEPE
jgi:hypothetical protein